MPKYHTHVINKNDDRPYKDIAAKWLAKQNYTDIKIVGFPTDITAVRDGILWHFEVKGGHGTKGDYWGTVTEEEMRQALTDPDHFRIITVWHAEKSLFPEDVEEWDCKSWTLGEILPFSNVTTWTTKFHVKMNNRNTLPVPKPGTIKATPEVLRQILTFFDGLRQAADEERARPVTNSLDI